MKMKVCAMCGSDFPQWAWVNGKQKVWKNRKYCFTCSPAGLHNTKQLHVPKAPLREGLQRCSSCLEFKERTKDNFHQSGPGKLAGRCRLCANYIAAENQRQIKKNAVAYKGGCCQGCGYNACSAALEFHHLDPSQKDFTINRAHATHKAFELVKKELDKCALLCANCHREVHSGIRVLEL